MKTLQRLFQYNAWANERVFRLCRELDPALLGADAAGTLGSLGLTLKHLVGVEDGYLARLSSSDEAEALGSREAYVAHDLDWFVERSLAVSSGYQALLAGRDETFLESELRIPWIKAPLTARDGLLQVATHSAQHRAQVLSTLGERGIKVPDVDYVFMMAEMQGADAS